MVNKNYCLATHHQTKSKSSNSMYMGVAQQRVYYRKIPLWIYSSYAPYTYTNTSKNLCISTKERNIPLSGKWQQCCRIATVENNWRLLAFALVFFLWHLFMFTWWSRRQFFLSLNLNSLTFHTTWSSRIIEFAKRAKYKCIFTRAKFLTWAPLTHFLANLIILSSLPTSNKTKTPTLNISTGESRVLLIPME